MPDAGNVSEDEHLGVLRLMSGAPTFIELLELTRYIWLFALIGALVGFLLPAKSNTFHMRWRAVLFLTLMFYGVCICLGNLTAVGGLSP
jgi:hypothetical protein